MQYFILSFGRTKYTKYTVDSLIASATRQPQITILNGGWTDECVPPEILLIWDSFVADYLAQKKISKVFNLPSKPHAGLNAFSIADSLATNSFYFITDNDCIIETKGFDERLLEKIQTHGLKKLGADFFRIISLEHAKQFATPQTDFDAYNFTLSNSRVCESGSEQTYCQVTNTAPAAVLNDPSITNNLSDTTLSIVRKGFPVSQHANRFSYSHSGLKMLHVGYLEHNFRSENTLEILEMMHYMKLRCDNLPEFKLDYDKRYSEYREAIRQEAPCLSDYYDYICRSWKV